ncbi:hypothetical protein BDA96_01G284300 [Sorghum bicolor]|uniref:Uncharacterized protein n=2 Tax=Sorghum bicolor TaxID=4558 RepID=A0A921QEI9_SORBI|nr:hypothetical protein BDA96_08G067900 [Sorghum bicolor]KAG0549784.1 hypothetical protein BDA96_01G284300 [Sorghum bicolor]OQU91954.1 hypothetical protein SORBI_3001G263801 [Sorghum bicolor]
MSSRPQTLTNPVLTTRSCRREGGWLASEDEFRWGKGSGGRRGLQNPALDDEVVGGGRCAGGGRRSWGGASPNEPSDATA